MFLESEELNWFFKDKTKQGPFLFYQVGVWVCIFSKSFAES